MKCARHLVSPVAAAVLTLWNVCTSSFAQSVEITAFHDGRITWTNSTTNVACRVEWACSLDGTVTWQRDWQGPGFIFAGTSFCATAEVPMFYRVVVPQPTNEISGTWHLIAVAEDGRPVSFSGSASTFYANRAWTCMSGAFQDIGVGVVVGTWAANNTSVTSSCQQSSNPDILRAGESIVSAYQVSNNVLVLTHTNVSGFLRVETYLRDPNGMVPPSPAVVSTVNGETVAYCVTDQHMYFGSFAHSNVVAGSVVVTASGYEFHDAGSGHFSGSSGTNTVTGEILTYGVTGLTTYSGTLNHDSIRAGTVAISAGGFVFNDNGDGTLTGIPGTTGAIDYGTGAWSIDLGGMTIGAGTPVIASYQYAVGTSGAGAIEYSLGLWFIDLGDDSLTTGTPITATYQHIGL